MMVLALVLLGPGWAITSLGGEPVDVRVSVSNSPLPDLSWRPPADGFDWIQLKSGEWLKGRLKALQDREIDFDSAELDELEFDWKDIRQARFPGTLDVLFVDGEKTSGPVTVTPEQVVVGGVEERVHSRSRLQSLTPGGSWLDTWSGRGAFGLTLRGGNVEQAEYNARARLQCRTPATRLSLDYIGTFSRADGIESANNHRVNAEFDRWLSRRFYLILPFLEYFEDPFQNLAHRATVGIGAGYDLVDRQNLEWSLTAGPAYQHVWFDSSLPGEAMEKDAAALVIGTRLDWKMTRKIDLILEYQGQYTRREVGETIHHGVGTVSFGLTKSMDLDISCVWDRIADPKVGDDGVQPKPDDYRLIVALGVEF
jgi:hypothetical protein